MSQGKIKVPHHVAELIRSMHPQLKKKIRAALEIIRNNPESGKALRIELKGLMTFRVSNFRIVYRIGSRGIIELIAIGPRKTIYEETFRLITKE